MTEQSSSNTPSPEGQGKLHADAIVERVLANGDSAQTVALTGLLGQGKDDDVWRLYLSHQFDEYVEFSASDVVHSQAIDEATPLAGTVVWVRRSARLQYTHVASRQVQADFLQGGIATQHLPAAGVTAFATGRRPETGYACTRNYVCSTNPHIPACQLQSEVCGSTYCPPPTGPFCPSGAFVC